MAYNISLLNKHILLQELQKYAEFQEEDFAAFLELFVSFTIKKGDYFYQAGEIPKYSPFIIKGCMRKFYMDDNGDEHIVFFAEEGWFAGEVQCMRTKTKTQMNLQALEDCEILGISLENAEYAFKTFPAYRQYFDTKYTLDHNRIIQETTQHKKDSPEILYLRLLETRPSLIQRVALNHIANYLGVTPETISRIRKKIAGK